MTAKRSRIHPSFSSFVSDTDIIKRPTLLSERQWDHLAGDPMLQISSPNVSKESCEQSPSWPGIFEVSFSVEVKKKEKSGYFLDHCHMCNMKLGNDVVFMYGDLGAYCSAECRDKQMTLDGYELLEEAKPPREGKTGVKKDQIGSQLRKRAIPKFCN